MNHKTDMQAPTEIYVWFADNKGTERDGERFIRAWTMDPVRADGLRGAIGKAPAVYRAIEASQSAGVPEGWALEPIEPTSQQLEGMCESYWGDGWDDEDLRYARIIDARNMYKAGLAAAPAPVSEPKQPNPNRAAEDPGGCECVKCGRIFIGAEHHDECGVCASRGVEHPIERGEQDCPHGVDDGACTQRYGEATSGAQGAALSDDAAVLSRLASVLETGHAHNGIADDNATIYAAALRRILAASTPTLGDEQAKFGYENVVSICDAHGIGLPVDCIEMVVEIVRYALPQPQAAEPKGMTEAIEALQCPETHSYSNPELFERGWEIGRSAALDIVRALLAKGE